MIIQFLKIIIIIIIINVEVCHNLNFEFVTDVGPKQTRNEPRTIKKIKAKN